MRMFDAFDAMPIHMANEPSTVTVRIVGVDSLDAVMSVRGYEPSDVEADQETVIVPFHSGELYINKNAPIWKL